MPGIAAISQRIWDMKYRFKTAEGEPVDREIADTWRRVATALAAPESDPQAWAPHFEEALSRFEFLPAGRILAGAGTGRSVTLFNCFVMGTIEDDLGSIFAHLREAALTMQQGGGIGYDFSTLRPKGAPVHGVGADASGPLSFMDVWDSMCRTIMSAGARRGAMMATLRCDHPDIEAFIDAKREPGRLRMFNLSVLVTDAFMDAVKADKPWPLVFGDRVYRVVQARALWDRIMQATYAYAEPGVIFIDRINESNNLRYAERISATNPCVSADTWVQTAEGPRRVGDLVGRPFMAVVNGVSFPSTPEGFFKTGTKPLLRITTTDGFALRVTADHPVRSVVTMTRYGIESAWTKAGTIAPGDRIVLNEHGTDLHWEGAYGEAEGYLVGLLVGDGTLKEDKAVLSVWPGEATVNGGLQRPGVAGVMDAALAAAHSLPHRSDFNGWVTVPGRGERRLALGSVKRIVMELGMAPGSKTITPAVERTSSAFHRGFLRGLFDADGAVLGDHEKGISIRLAQSDLDRLRAVQRMLLRLGIVGRLYAERRPAGMRLLPDGKGGRKEYQCAADHELIIAKDNVSRFAERIGFADTEKQARLRAAIAGYRRTPNRERFVAEVATVTEDGVEDVYDAQILGANAFDANGVLVHNCGEQPLPPYGACLLGSINLAGLVRDPFEDTARLDMDRLRELTALAVRMMDNVVDASRFPLPEQAREAQAKRRIGLGVTGLADALILCRTRYGTERAVALTDSWLGTIKNEAYRTSARLAAEKGAFPLFDRDAYLAAPMVRSLDADVRALIERHGVRNALLTSIAPTGTISLFADNVSSGIEPVFSYSYERTVLLPDGARRTEEVSDHAYRLFRAAFGPDRPLPDYFVDAQVLTPAEHVVMQAAAQRHIDSSISKTINCPEDLPFDAFKDVYRQAYELGCKGCTTYRPNAVTGSVLAVKKEEPKAETPPPAPPVPAETGGHRGEVGSVVYMTKPLDRPEALPGETYKVRWPDSDHAMYITINDIIEGGRRRPFEVFINSKNMEHYAWTVALTRMISAVFRRGGDVSFVVEELKAVFDPRGGAWMQGRYVPSLLAAIGDVIERHLKAIGMLPEPDTLLAEAARKAMGDPEVARPTIEPPAVERSAVEQSVEPRPVPTRQCPKCGQPGLIRQEGCDTCLNCGYSKCSG
ncbi:LAGLIDADG family homing endonuclease [Azospirillum canadense]|uniref:LAGLIDADG family homing endonuclease n=1 Tax=Azospirillum canadense TaxID=403962 RepID=UPI002226D63C|nr:LAGLIDADG family homing endonuclease [Azospirillum canadense]MCW2242732.1 ribonucleoside-diphosphate reductase alpha chain [Azospirillum canadense]